MPAKDNKRKRTKQQSSPKRKLSPLPKVPHKNLPIRPYDRTKEENAAIAKAEKEAHFAKKTEPAPPVYIEKKKGWARGFVTTPRQYDLHHKPDNYLCILQKESSKSKSSKSTASGSRSSARGERRRDVPQLGQQARQSIPPLNVVFEAAPQLVMQKDMEEARKLAADMGVTVEQLLGPQDDNLPKAKPVRYIPLGNIWSPELSG